MTRIAASRASGEIAEAFLDDGRVASDQVAASADTLSTRDWIDAARNLLIGEGVEAVKIGRIAKQCGVTRGGFYWRFRDRTELLDALLQEWRDTNSAPLLAALRQPGSAADRFRAAVDLWVDEREFDPRFDTAVRNWALTSADVASVVHEVDEERIEAFAMLFRDGGYDDEEAVVRARVVYFHQIGYYTLRLNEEREGRLRLLDMYRWVLSGFREFKPDLGPDGIG